jgi:carboxylate-amine ligase
VIKCFQPRDDWGDGPNPEAIVADTFKIGLEEEYFLVDAETKSVARHMPKAFLDAAKQATAGQAMGEFLQSQVEVVTLPHTDMKTAREELRHLRQTVGRIAAEHGLAILASGTHPTADWGKSNQSEGDRYDTVMDDLQMIGQRNMLCGLHVHVEIPDPDDRVDVMTRMLPYLPLFVALATSSPFWRSRTTGLKGYRLAAYDELPRTGVPELFRNKDEFDAYVAALVKAGVMQDSSYVWWSMRPSLNNPTLELRAPDCPTLVDDSIAIAALYRALARRLWRNPQLNADLNAITRAIVVENKWRAQRYGVRGTFVGDNGAVTVAELLDQVIEETAEDAKALGCFNEMARCRTIVGAGTSADVQLAVFEQHGKTEDRDRALQADADWIAVATLQKLFGQRRHHHPAGARVDHAEPAQREQRQGLNRRSHLGWIVTDIRRHRSDQAVEQRADQRRCYDARVLFGQMSAGDRSRYSV